MDDDLDLFPEATFPRFSPNPFDTTDHSPNPFDTDMFAAPHELPFLPEIDDLPFLNQGVEYPSSYTLDLDIPSSVAVDQPPTFPSVAIQDMENVGNTMPLEGSVEMEESVNVMPLESSVEMEDSVTPVNDSVEMEDAGLYAPWKMRTPVVEDEYAKFTLPGFVALHLPFLCDAVTSMMRSGNMHNLRAIDINTTTEPANVLAVAREYLLAMTNDLAMAARVVIAQAHSSENVFAAKPSTKVANHDSPRLLLFFKSILLAALRWEDITSASQLEAFWRAQMQTETPQTYLEVLSGVIYMVLLAREMKMSRQESSSADQVIASRELQRYIKSAIVDRCMAAQ